MFYSMQTLRNAVLMGGIHVQSTPQCLSANPTNLLRKGFLMESYTFYETRQHSPLYIRKLRPGCALAVQVNGVNKMRFSSQLIGYEVGGYLLISLPVEVRKQFQSNMPMNGAEVVVRLLLEGEDGKCLAFKSNIEASMTHPHDFIFLSFSKTVESCELRKYPRLSTCMSAHVYSTNTVGDVLDGRMQDVSLGAVAVAFVLICRGMLKTSIIKTLNFCWGMILTIRLFVYPVKFAVSGWFKGKCILVSSLTLMNAVMKKS
jgi:hypothetical protein